jgi:hypothetical protein
MSCSGAEVAAHEVVNHHTMAQSKVYMHKTEFINNGQNFTNSYQNSSSQILWFQELIV